MALELQLNAGTARATIDAIEASISKLKTALASGFDTPGLDRFVSSLQGFKGFSPEAIQTVAALRQALQGLSGTRIDNIITALQQVNALNLGAGAQAIQVFAAALRGITVPPGLAQVVQEITYIGSAARAATSGVTGLTQALGGLSQAAGAVNAVSAAANNVRTAVQGVGTGAQSATAGMNQFNAAAQQASAALAPARAAAVSAAQATQQAGQAAASAGAAASGASGGWLNLGEALRGAVLLAAGMTLANLVQQTIEFGVAASQLSQKVDQMTLMVKTATKSSTEAAAANQFLKQTSIELGVSYESMVGSFGKFTLAMTASKFTMADTAVIFKDLSAAAAGLGLSAAQTDGVFKAFEQMASKGSIQMEELRQQLGDRLPSAVAIMAKTMGVSTQELERMTKAGQVGAENLGKFAAALKEAFAGDLAARVETFGFQWQRLMNIIDQAKEGFGRGLNEGLVTGVRMLADAMANPAFQQFASVVGSVIGTALGQITSLVSIAVSGFNMLVNAVRPIGAAMSAAFGPTATAVLSSLVTNVTVAIGVFTLLRVPLIAITGGMTAMAGAAGLGAIAMSGLRLATMGLMAAFTPLGLVVGAVSAAVLSAIVYWDSFSQTVSYVVNSTLNFVQVLFDVVNKITGLALSVEGARAALMGFGSSVDTAVAATRQLASEALEQAKQALTSSGNAATSAASAFSGLGQSAAAAAPPVDKLNKSHDDGAKAAAAYDREIQKMLTDMDKEAAAAEKAASAQTNLGAARARAASSGGGSSGPTWNEYGTAGNSDMQIYAGQFRARRSGEWWASMGASGGGLTSDWKGATYAVHSSLFEGAPKFAGGGTTGPGGALADGGMPAILHPNEAVVPLTGGGEIPIAFTAGGGGASGDFLRDIADKTAEQTTRITTHAEIQQAQMAQLIERVNTLNTTVQTMSDLSASRLSSIQSSSLSTTGSTAASTAAATPAAVATSRYTEDGGSRGGTFNNGMGFGGAAKAGSGGATYDANGRMTKDADGTEYVYNAATLNADKPQKRYQLADGTWSDQPYRLNYVPTFDTGTPNTSRDVPGMTSSGGTVTVHPDEAIIPLPDGRSVPVTIRGAAANGGAGAVNVHVTMNVYCKDAGSFRASEDQILQEMQRKLERAAQNLGKTTTVDDPTRRV